MRYMQSIHSLRYRKRALIAFYNQWNRENHRKPVKEGHLGHCVKVWLNRSLRLY
jgi:hypothetical protein